VYKKEPDYAIERFCSQGKRNGNARSKEANRTLFREKIFLFSQVVLISFKVTAIFSPQERKHNIGSARKEIVMKRRYIAATLGIFVSIATVVSGCSGTTTASSVSTASSGTVVSASKYAGDTIYGEVTAVSDDSVTIDIGTKSEDSSDDQAKTDENLVASSSADADSSADTDNADSSSADNDADADSANSSADTDNADSKSADNSGSADSSADTDEADSSSADNSGDADSANSSSADNSGDADSGKPEGMKAPGSSVTLDKTGESTEITVTDDTTISRSMGGPGGGAPSGEAPSGEKPSGDAPSGEKPDKKPDSDSSDSNSDSTGAENASDASSNGSNQADSEDVSANSSNGSDQADSDNTSADSSSSSQTSGKPDGTPPDMENDSMELSDLQVGDIVEITLDEDGNASEITVLSSSQSGGNVSASNVSYTAVKTYDTDTTESDETVDSTGTDEEGILVTDGATADLSNMTVTRTSSDSTGGDNSSFYGVGAAVLTTEGTTYLGGSTVETDAKGGAGVFSYGENSTTYVKDTTISTTQDTSGGIHVAGGGTLYAYDLDVTTQGESSAAIRSDRGGGTMVVDGGTYTSNGTGSPAVYSTADIAISDADLTANGSEAVCIEGSNSVRLFNCDLSGNMSDNEQNDSTWNVILYQSMSGDSEEGNSIFEMNGGTLTAKNGGMFYTTNTESTFYLSDVDITYADENDYFLKCTGNSNARGWGESGSNGADCSFTANDQEMEGNIIWDSISKLDFYMTGSSTLTGAILDDESNAGDGGDGYANLYIESGSKWIVTGDSTLSALYNAGTITDSNGNTVTVKGTDGTVYVQGTSDYTITVDSYSTEADTSGATSATSWSDYAVEAPDELN
jgi:hypothetical protein